MIIVLIINIIGIILAAKIIFVRPQIRLYKVFILTVVLMLLWVNLGFAPRVLGENFSYAGLISLRVAWLVTPLFFASLYYLGAILSGSYQKIKVLNWSIGIISTISAIVAGFSSCVVSGIKFTNSFVIINYGDGINIYLFIILLLITATVLTSISGYREKRRNERRKLIFFYLGLTIFYILNIIFNIIYPIFLHNSELYWLGDYSTLAVVVFTYIGMLQHNFLNVRILYQRHFLNTGLSIIPLSIVLFLLLLLAYKFNHSPSRNTIIIALFFFAFFIYPFILRRVESFVDRRILHYRRTSTETLRILSRNLNGAMEIATISKTILEELDRSLNLTGIAFYEPLDRTARYRCTQSKTNRKATFPSEVQLPHQLQRELTKGEVIYRRDIEILTHENPKAARYIDDLAIEILVPFVFKQKVIGLLVITEKKYHEAFSADESKMIDALSAQLSTIIHRANLFDRTKRFAQDLSVKVERATKEITQKNKQLQEVTESRNRFFADIAHEFKTPLTILKGNIDLVAQSTDAEDRDLLLRELSRLENLTSDLLELSRNESGTQTLQHTTIDPLPFFDHLRDELSNFAAERKMTIHCNIDKTPFVADKEKMSKLVSNLLSNAIKYGNADGNIWLTYKNHAQSIAISVRDDGPGIATEHLPHLFERFYRVDKRESRALGGTGLGLAIVKSIVDLHHGTIAVQSTIPTGTTFSITLPKSKK